VRLLGWPGGDFAAVRAGSPGAAAALEADSTAALHEAAQLVDGRLDVMESNLRALVEPHVGWSYSHGSLLAALALAHGGLAEARLAGTLPLGKVVPLGSHPLLDPLWSTESTRIVHHAAETTRVSKVAALARRPDVLATLRVCDRLGELGNCGICDKCVRTMLALELAGAQAPFDVALSRRRIRRLGVAKPIERAFGEELLNAFASAQRLDLAHALQLAFVGDLSNRAIRRLAALPADWLHRLRSRAG